MRSALLFCGVVAAVATNVRSKSTVSHRRFFPNMEPLLAADELSMLVDPPSDAVSDMRKLLRGSALDSPLPSASRLALPMTNIEVIPLDGDVSDVPEEDSEDGANMAASLTADGVEAAAAPVAAEGPLRDLVDFGSAIGAAVLPRVGPVRGGPIALPMDILHVKMQQEVPKPLTVDDTPGNVHIYGTLPSNLTAKTLQVSSEGRNLVVRYFIDGGKQARNSIVGIDERFTLDFDPLENPVVHYSTATGTFELTLPRPAKEKSGEQVTIEFDDASKQQKVAPRPAAAPLVEEVVAKPTEESTRKTVEKIADEFADHFRHTPAPTKASLPKVVSTPTDDSIPKAMIASGAVRRPNQEEDRAAAEEAVASAKALREKAEENDAKTTLAKMTKELREAEEAKKPVTQADQAKRAKEIADKAKRFVAEAKLGDAKTELASAFAPEIFDGEGMVLLELNHKSL